MSEETKGSKVIRAGIGYTVGNYLLKGLTFLTVPLFSRLLSTAEYGVFNAYLAYQTILYLLVGLALHTSLKNAKYRYKEEFDRYNSGCILLVIASAALAARLQSALPALRRGGGVLQGGGECAAAGQLWDGADSVF